MDRPFFRDTSHLTEEQKCILALQQALEQEHGEHRIHELRERLMKFSIMNLNVGISIEVDKEEWE